MNDLEISQLLEKLQYQIKTLGETIDHQKNPMEALILENDWGPGEVDKAHDIFDAWDKRLQKGDEMGHAAFERDFAIALNVSYQGLKSIVLAFYRNFQWTDVCEAYVDSFGKRSSIEYSEIAQRNR